MTIDGITAHHKLNYLMHTSTGHVITSQYKAWNDQVRMALWYEVVMKPIADQHGVTIMVWQDNCSIHHTNDVQLAAERTGCKVMFFAPDMTQILQPMDVAVNGPLKRHLREERADIAVDSFQKYIEAYGDRSGTFGSSTRPN